MIMRMRKLSDGRVKISDLHKSCEGQHHQVHQIRNLSFDVSVEKFEETPAGCKR